MPLNPQMIIASDLQSLFRDKDTGLPLRNGIIYFWQDAARTVPKDVYKLTGSPPDYSYVNIGSEINLTASGTISDNENPANDIILYYFPYEGTPDDTTGVIELYYVEVYSEGGKTSGVLQFTRQAWPNETNAESASQNVPNLIPNGQFKIHSDIPANNDVNPILVAGEIREPITVLTQGGWTFERPNTSAAKDIVLFNNFGGYVSNPSASPDYYIQIENQSPSAGDAYKDLRIKFDDVNKFASDTQTYTFAFWAQSNSGNTNVSLILIKNYGTGGTPSPTEEISISNFVIGNSFTVYQKNGFTFGDNSGKTLGTNGDDYIQLAIRFPTGALFDVSLTDFILTPGNVTITTYPQTTDSQFCTESITPAVPAYDNSNLYLPIKLTPTGTFYDDSEIGEVISEANISNYVNSLHPTSNKMLCDGTQYETAAYSPLGIPYSRLQAKIWDGTYPIYGTGLQYALAVLNGSGGLTNQIILTNNSAAVVTPPADGTVATGFTFQTIHTGIASPLNCVAWYVVNEGFTIMNSANGAVTAPTAGTSSFGVLVDQTGNSFLPERTRFSSPVSVSPGHYLTFNTTSAGYYLWFKVSGAGVDPAVPGRTGILIDLTSGDAPDTVVQKCAMVINSMGQSTGISTVAAASITAGAYFTFVTSGDSYYVYYVVDGVGTDPQVANSKPIPVEILGTDTAQQVASKTQIAINYKYFAAPDFRGFSLKGLGVMNRFPDNNSFRYSYIPAINSNNLGTFEVDSNKNHSHQYTYVSTGSGEIAGGTDTSIVESTVNTSTSGEQEVRVFNKNVNYAIRY